MNLAKNNRQYATLIAPIECAARALKLTAYREYRVVTPSVDAYVDLLVIHQSHRIVYVEGRSVDGVRWNILKAKAVKAEALRIVFPNERIARTAQKCVEKVKASGKINVMAISCLTADAAVQQLKNSNRLMFGSNISPIESQGLASEPKNKSSPPTARMNQHYRNEQGKVGECCDSDKSWSRIRP